MGQPAAKQGDQIMATDMHLIQPPGSTSPVLIPHPFVGIIDGNLSSDVNIIGMPAATEGSTATNTPPHIPSGGTFVNPPRNQGEIKLGSQIHRNGVLTGIIFSSMRLLLQRLQTLLCTRYVREFLW